MHYRNSEYFAAFQCALTKRMLDLRGEHPDNPIEATFLDTFYIPGHRVFEGQRTLITAEGIEKPILNALRLLGRLGTRRLAVTAETSPGVEVLATGSDDARLPAPPASRRAGVGQGSLRIMAVNFAEALEYDRTHSLRVQLQGLPAGSWRCRHYRIDRDHSNAYSLWLSLGRPIVPDQEQLAKIRSRQGLELLEPESTISTSAEGVCLETTLPPHSASLWVLDKPRPGETDAA